MFVIDSEHFFMAYKNPSYHTQPILSMDTKDGNPYKYVWIFDGRLCIQSSLPVP